MNDPKATCVSCGVSSPSPDMIFDERAEIFFCDRRCFDDWAGDNIEKVGEFYYRMNIE